MVVLIIAILVVTMFIITTSVKNKNAFWNIITKPEIGIL
jgi:hypothetical protein